MAKQATRQPTPSAADSIMETLGAATADDLATIDDRIGELQKEIDSLSVVRKLIDVKLNGKPKRKSPSKAKSNGQAAPTTEKASGQMPLDMQIRGLIKEQGCPLVPDAIARALGVSLQAVAVSAGKSNSLEKTPDGKITLR